MASHVAPRRGACIQDWNDLHVAENELHVESICISFPIWLHAVSAVEKGLPPSFVAYDMALRNAKYGEW